MKPNSPQNKIPLLRLFFLIAIVAGFWFLRDAALPGSQPVTVQQEQNSGSSPTQDLNAYIDYSSANLSAAQEKGHAVLFFAATIWCETCSALDQEISERIRDIPSDLTILKVDFDRNTELKNRYSVAYQHTLILLDQEGKILHRWIGGGLDELLLQVNGTV